MIDYAWLAEKQEGGVVEPWLDERGHSLVPLSNPGFVLEMGPEGSGSGALLRGQSGERGALAQGDCRTAAPCLLAASCLIIASALR